MHEGGKGRIPKNNILSLAAGVKQAQKLVLLDALDLHYLSLSLSLSLILSNPKKAKYWPFEYFAFWGFICNGFSFAMNFSCTLQA